MKNKISSLFETLESPTKKMLLVFRSQPKLLIYVYFCSLLIVTLGGKKFWKKIFNSVVRVFFPFPDFPGSKEFESKEYCRRDF